MRHEYMLFVVSTLSISFRPKEVGNHWFIVLVNKSSDDLANLALRKNKICNNDDGAIFLGVHWTFLILMWFGIVPNSTILFVHVCIHLEMDLVIENAIFVFRTLAVDVDCLAVSTSDTWVLIHSVYFVNRFIRPLIWHK